MTRTAAAAVAAAVWALGFVGRAEEATAVKEEFGEGTVVEAAGETKAKNDVFLTGLDFSYWVADKGPTIGGPGVMVGFVLAPRHLEMDFALGAMMGGHQYTIPFEMAFTIPFYVNSWFAPFIKFGPTVITDKVQRETNYDFAVSASAGVEIVPTKFDWSLYACGDYNARTAQETRHQGGFTVGFHYRI
jgi:hypothetical protein